MAASPSKIAHVLAQLRDQVRVREARSTVSVKTAEGHLSTGMRALDAALSGGLPRGKLIELCGPRSSSRLSIAVSAMREAVGTGESVALIDVADAFDPRSAESSGLSFERLLWIRPRTLLDGFKVSDLVLDAGGFGLVVLYLCGVSPVGLRRMGLDAIATRLRHRAERAQSALLVVVDAPLLSSVALAGRLRTTRARTHWHGQGVRLLDGLDGEVALELKQAVLAIPLSFAVR